MAARKTKSIWDMYKLPYTQEADGINVGRNGKVCICYILTLTECTSWLNILLYSIIWCQLNLISDIPLKNVMFNESLVTKVN